MFAALRHRDYRLFFLGQFISLCGTHMQRIALPWFVYQITGSKLMLGLVSATTHVPVLLLSLVGGVTADRYPKRYVLVCTQTVMMLCALVLWGCIITDLITMPIIFAAAFISGIASALDVPARQSFVVEMVGKEDLMNAIALNSSMFSTARILGPSIGGIIIASLGVAPCFLLNGLSYLAIIVALLLMTVPPRTANGVSQSVWHDVLQGLRYASREPVVRTVLILIGVSTIFGTPYQVLLPVFAKDVLKVGAQGLGFMLATNGIGAAVIALGLASLGDFPRKGALTLGSAFVTVLALVMFSVSHQMALSLVCLAVVGGAMTIYRAMCNTLLQTIAPDDLRGRVMSLFSLGFLGLSPFGSMQAGFVAQYLGAPMAVGIGAAVMGLSALAVLLAVPRMRAA
jgi:MFS family permease